MDLLTRRSLTFDFLSSWRVRVHWIFGREKLATGHLNYQPDGKLRFPFATVACTGEN